jgi:hypothetical protein
MSPFIFCHHEPAVAGKGSAFPDSSSVAKEKQIPQWLKPSRNDNSH